MPEMAQPVATVTPRKAGTGPVPLPAALVYGTVSWAAVGTAEDTDSDIDSYPDAKQINGWATFTAHPKKIVKSGEDAVTVLPLPNRYQILTGRLIDKEGRTDISLVGNDSPGTTPQGWSYHVDWELEDGVTFGSFDFYLKGGDVLDLSNVQPLEEPSPGVIITKGEKGEKGEKGDPGTGDDGFVANLIRIGSSQTSKAMMEVSRPRLDSATAPAPAVLLDDSFAGANLTSLNAHVPATGGAPWSVVSGAIVLDGAGAATQSTNAVNDAHAVRAPGADNYTATFGCISRMTSSTQYAQAGVLYSYIDANNFFHIEVDLKLQALVAYKKVAGTFTQLLQYALPTVFTSGQEYQIRVDHYGTDTTIWLDGVEIITLSEPEMATATGKIGLRVGANGAVAAPAWTFVTAETYRGTRLNLPRPTKYSGNPVIALGATGTWDDVDINNPNVTWDPAYARWVASYSGYPADTTNVQHMGVAYATSLYGPWTKEVANPVFSSVAEDGIYAMNGGLVFWRGLWWHAYNSNNGTTIRMATAPALTGPWTRRGVVLAAAPIGWDSTGVYDPYLRIRQDGRTMELWYAAADKNNGPTLRHLGFAASTDGLTFTRNPAPIIPYQRFSLGNFAEPAVYVPPGREGQQMMVTYDIVLPWASTRRWIGCGITLDGGATWHHAVLSRAGSGWEAGQNFDSFPMVHDGRFFIFYGAAPAGGLQLGAAIQIGVASCEWNGSTLAA